MESSRGEPSSAIELASELVIKYWQNPGRGAAGSQFKTVKSKLAFELAERAPAPGPLTLAMRCFALSYGLVGLAQQDFPTFLLDTSAEHPPGSLITGSQESPANEDSSTTLLSANPAASSAPAAAADGTAAGVAVTAAMARLSPGGKEGFCHLLLAAMQQIKSGGTDSPTTLVPPGPDVTPEHVQALAEGETASEAAGAGAGASGSSPTGEKRRQRRADAAVTRAAAALLLVEVMQGKVDVEPRIAVRLMQTTAVGMPDLAAALGAQDGSSAAAAAGEAAGSQDKEQPESKRHRPEAEGAGDATPGLGADALESGDGAMGADPPGGAATLVSAYVNALAQRRLFPAAVGVMQHLQVGVEDAGGFLLGLVEAGLVDLAGDCAHQLGSEQHGADLVRKCMRRGLFKTAYKLVCRLNLEEVFPDAKMLYRRSSLRKLAEKGVWDIAESLAGEEPQLQQYLVELALELQELTLAHSFCRQFGLDASALPIDESELKPPSDILQLEDMLSLAEEYDPAGGAGSSSAVATAAAATAGDGEAGAPPLETVNWVDSPAALAAMARCLSASPAVALDCEWRPLHVKGTANPKVAVLQLASRRHAFLLDMPLLAAQHPQETSDALGLLFHSPGILKLGFAVDHDLKSLHASYPRVAALAQCAPVLDLQSALQLVKPGALHALRSPPAATDGPVEGPGGGGKEGVGLDAKEDEDMKELLSAKGMEGVARQKASLKATVQAVLGKRMDVRARMTDWEARPLTLAQMKYGALDSLSLHALRDALAASYPFTDRPFLLKELERAFSFSVPARRRNTTY